MTVAQLQYTSRRIAEQVERAERERLLAHGRRHFSPAPNDGRRSSAAPPPRLRVSA